MVAQLLPLSKSRTLISSPQKMPSGLILSLLPIFPPPPHTRILALCSQWRHTVWPLSGACLVSFRRSVCRACVLVEQVARGFGLILGRSLPVCRARQAPPQAFKARLLFSATWWSSRAHAGRIILESILFQICFMIFFLKILLHQTSHSVSAMFCKNELRNYSI